jgi:CorA-like Mg2+ transporter protein
MEADPLDIDASALRSATVWEAGKHPGTPRVGNGRKVAGVPWFDLVSSTSAEQLFPSLAKDCQGLTEHMLDDLLTPDDRPEGATYSGSQIKLASTFTVEARRLEQKRERGSAMRSGVLVFQPVELLASKDWLLTCWHPTRTFAGAEKVAEGEPGTADTIRKEISEEWMSLEQPGGGDLGILIMNRLALAYRATGWRLAAWHEDWELSLYVEDALDNPDELPNLWGMMAVLRDWLNPLNRPGLRKMPDRAWLPNNNHDRVVAIDDRVDDTLEQLQLLSGSMRASFSVLHVQTAEAARDRKEHTQHRVELIAAIFLVPTLVVGFYGANTWVPGQGKHWGFWVMLVALLILTSVAVATVLNWRHQERSELRRITDERNASRQELLRAVR